MSGVRDIGKIMQCRAERQDKPSPAVYSPMRTCAGECRVRRSIAQFNGDSAMCKQCARRAPTIPETTTEVAK